MVPALTLWIGMPLRRALGTSLLVIAVLVIPGTIVHALLGNIDWAIFLVLVLGVVPGRGSGLASRSASVSGRCASRSEPSCSSWRSRTQHRRSPPWPRGGGRMARPIMRRLSPLVLALLFVLLFVLWAPPPSPNAQESPAVRLTLLSQTSWNCPTATADLPSEQAGWSCPRARARPAFPGREPGDRTLTDLAIGVTLYSRVLTRSAYEDSLVSDPRSSSTPARCRGKTRSNRARRATSRSRSRSSRGSIPSSPASTRSSSTCGAGSPRSPSCERRPSSSSESPRSRSACHGRSCSLTRSCSRRTAPSPILPRDRARPGRPVERRDPRAARARVGSHGGTGRRRRVAGAADAARPDAAGYEVSVGGETRRVPAGEGGAALAGQALENLRTIAAASNVEVTALPFSAPEIPSLYGGGLGRDVVVQLERGREVASTFVGTEMVEQILRPPGAILDEPTLRGLFAAGIRTLLVGPSTVEPPRATARLRRPGHDLAG